MTIRNEPDWSDWVAVERAVNGHPVGRALSLAEKREVVRRLLARGCGIGHINDTIKTNWALTKQLIQEVQQ